MAYIEGMNLNENEYRVLIAAVLTSDQLDDDFYNTYEDVIRVMETADGLSKKQVNGYLLQLDRKGYITIEEDGGFWINREECAAVNVAFARYLEVEEAC